MLKEVLQGMEITPLHTLIVYLSGFWGHVAISIKYRLFECRHYIWPNDPGSANLIDANSLKEQCGAIWQLNHKSPCPHSGPHLLIDCIYMLDESLSLLA